MEKLLKAIYFATSKHINQKRKDKLTPYISHPLAVAVILSRVTTNKDIIIAGILHDVIEDSDATKEQIEELFGSRVARMVVDCSEEDKSLCWEKRKHEVLKKISRLSDNSSLVKTADILHNTYDSVQGLKKAGVSYFENFNASVIDKFSYERERLEKFKKHHPNNKLIGVIENYLMLIEKAVGQETENATKRK